MDVRVADVLRIPRDQCQTMDASGCGKQAVDRCMPVLDLLNMQPLHEFQQALA
jgi:hypothetical protein